MDVSGGSTDNHLLTVTGVQNGGTYVISIVATSDHLPSEVQSANLGVLCVCVCVCARAHTRVCVCVCVCSGGLMSMYICTYGHKLHEIISGCHKIMCMLYLL